MSTTNINEQKITMQQIDSSDTITQFMEKCNNNFAEIAKFGGGPKGVKGEEGSQGVPTKPKVPIHVWKKTEGGNDNDYTYEESTENGFEIEHWYNDLSNNIYQDGHLVILENGHVYMLSADDNFELNPKYIFSMQSYDPGSIIDGKESYVHFAYTNDIESFDGFITDSQIRKGNIDSIYNTDRLYIGVYCDHTEKYSDNPYSYTWTKIKGKDGIDGKDGISSSLLYLGSFEEDNKSLQGYEVYGLLLDGRCDYYTDINGETWMRKGSAVSAVGKFSGNYNDDNWLLITKPALFNEGSININTINTNSITPESEFVSKLFSVGSDKIIVKSGIAGEGDDSTLFYVYPGEILMEVGNFGIKIDKNGIYRKTDGEWLNWE